MHPSIMTCLAPGILGFLLIASSCERSLDEANHPRSKPDGSIGVDEARFKELYARQFERILAYDSLLLDFSVEDEARYSWVRRTVVADLFDYWIRTNSSAKEIDELEFARHRIKLMLSKHPFGDEELADPFFYFEHGFEPDVPFAGINQETFGDLDGYRIMISEFIEWLDGVESGRHPIDPHPGSSSDTNRSNDQSDRKR